MTEIIISSGLFDKHDEQGKISGFIESKNIILVKSNPKNIRNFLPKAPYLEFNTYDREGSETLGEVILKPILQIPLTKEQAKLIELYNKD